MRGFLACLVYVFSLFTTNLVFGLDKDLQQITNHLNEYALFGERGLEPRVGELHLLQNQLNSWHERLSRTGVMTLEVEEQFIRLNTRIQNFLNTAQKDQKAIGTDPIFAPVVPQVPGNDNCDSAYTVGNGTFSGHTSLANADGWASCYNSTSPDVWFLYVAPENDTVVFTTAGSDYDTVLSIHNPNTNGCPGDPTDQIACAGESGYPQGAKIVLPVDAGTSYLVRVSGSGSDSKGNYVLSIAPAGFISGHVSNQITQAPIPDIYVLFYKQGAGYVGTTITNSNGNYVSPDLPSGTYFIRTSNNINFVDELYDDIPCHHGNCNINSGTPVIVDSNTVEGIDFGLNPTGSISGTVTSFDGSPLNSIFLNAYDSSGNSQASAITDNQGHYLFTGLNQGVFYVRTTRYGDDYIDELYDNISCPGYCDPTTGTPINVSYGNETPGIDFALDLGGAITGTIQDSSDLTPLSDGYVYVFDSSGNFIDITYPQYPNGFYASTGLPSGNYFVQTSSTDGYVEELYDNIPCYFDLCDTLNGTPVPVTINTITEDIDFLLDRTGSISGTITDESGSPIPDVYVAAVDPNNVFVSYDYTDQNGKYVLGELVTGTYFVTTSSEYMDEVYDDIPCEPYCDATTGDPISVVISNETSGIDFVLGIGGSVSGTITDSVTSDPVAGFVYIFDSFGNSVQSTFTDSSGQYTFSGLVTGNYFVLTSVYDQYLNELYDNIPCHFGCDILSGTPIPAAPGNPTTGIDFQLIPTGKITGTIKKASNGQALGGISVEVYNSAGGYVTSTYSDSLGIYRANILTADDYYVVARPYNIYIQELYDNIHCSGSNCDFAFGTPVPADVGTVTNGIDFDLEIGGSISGTVVDEFTGDPIPYSSVYVYDANGNFVQPAYCDQNGVYISDTTLATGTYFVRTNAGSGYTNELYDNHPCEPSCVITDGDPVSVTEGSTTSNIDFALIRPTISIDDVSIQEGNSGAQQMIFTVTMSSPVQSFVRVWFEDDDGTAWGNFDYQPVFGYVDINPGNVSATISVAIFGDIEVEPDETFTMRLRDAINATIIDNGGTGTILNDDSGNCSVINIDPPTLPNGVVNVPYNVTLSASGGTPPYTFVVSSGVLPPGLSLNADIISGIPQTAGTYNFIISVTDSAGCPGSKSYSITIDLPGTCQLFGDDFEDGTVDPLLWTIVKPDFAEQGGEFIGTPLNRKAQALATGFSGCGANCTMDTTMQTGGGVGAKVIALGWYQDKSNKVEVIMNQNAGTWIIKQRLNGKVVARRKGSASILMDTPYTVRLSFDGQQFMLHVTGNQTDLTLVMDKAQGSNPFGTFGYEAKETSGRFSSICVN